MDDVQDVLDLHQEPPFIFSESLSLQKLASTKLALRLWRDRICSSSKPKRLWYYHAHPFSCRKIIVVQTHIADIIDERIVLIGNELRFWLDIRLLKLFPEIFPIHSWSENGNGICSALFDNIVFKRDCTFCVKSIATYILTSTEIDITPILKYKIACEFCLENYVREFWPLVNNEVNKRDGSPLVLYWNDVMMNTRKAEIEESELMYSIKNNVEYLWDKLSKSEQTRLAIKVLNSISADFRVAKFVLPKLDEIQTERVCAEVGDSVFRIMMEKAEYFEYALKSWIYMKNFIPGNVFYRIIHQLWSIVSLQHSESKLMIIQTNADLLHEIWITASHRLKKFVLDHDSFVTSFAKLDDQVRSIHNYDLEFLFTVLVFADHELRRVVWQNNWRILIFRIRPWKLEEIMRLCLSDEEEILQFKEREMTNFDQLENFFSWCMDNGFFAELSDYLHFCLKDSRRLENLSKEIMLSNLDPILLCDENELGKIHWFINTTFRDVQSITKFMNELLLTPECLGFIYCKIDEGRFDEVMSIASRFPTSEKNLNELKRGFLNYCSRNLARGHITKFDGQKFGNFLSWCALNETTVSEFKQSLIIDDIFDIIVNKVIKEGLTSHKLQSCLDLNNFLEWYFGSSIKVHIYKSSVFNDKYLKWAFDNDENKISVLKSMLGCE